MRNYIKNRLLELTETMEQAGIYLMDRMERGNMADVLAVLEDEQQSAIKIGEVIEESEGEGQRVVTLLEEYCELLWQCSQESDQNNRVRYCKDLVGLCREIKKKIRDDIPVQYEAVFLPYKASMWDSLESIWLAAKEEPDWNSYVMPIPYYDRKPDLSLGTMHYEGEQFPPYVPVTSYQEYDLKTRHPDAIFIHNPYDEYNYVTSVHPAYYSSAIKNYTELLIYVPYYICIDDVPEWHCTEAGVLNADLVIVQSEKVRQTYIRTLRKALGFDANPSMDAGLNKKIVALGSPKMDKVINTERRDIVLPEEWRAKIYGEI